MATVIEVINTENEKLLNAILQICSAYYADTRIPNYYADFYRLALSDPRSIICIVREGSKIIGYILGIRHDCPAIKYVVEKDAEFNVKDFKRYYVDTLEIYKKNLSYYDFVRLIKIFVAEATENRGIRNFSMYTRQKVTKKIMRVLLGKIKGEINLLRTIVADWYGGTPEKYDYLEATPE